MIKADFGEDLGYGFKSFDDAMATLDLDNLSDRLHTTWKINGQVYELVPSKDIDGVAFKKVEEE